MKRKLLLLITIIFSIFFIGITNVNAEEYLEWNKDFKNGYKVYAGNYYDSYITSEVKQIIGKEQFVEAYISVYPDKITKSNGGVFSFTKLYAIEKSINQSYSMSTQISDSNTYLVGLSDSEFDLLKKLYYYSYNENDEEEEDDYINSNISNILALENSINSKLNNTISYEVSDDNQTIVIDYPQDNKYNNYIFIIKEKNNEKFLILDHPNADNYHLRKSLASIAAYNKISVTDNNSISNYSSSMINKSSNTSKIIKNPKTSDLNVFIAISAIGLFAGVIIVSSKRLKKIK